MSERQRLKQIGRRVGTFNDRIILGRHFEDEHAARCWHITTWPMEGYPIDEYWIDGGKFYEMLGTDISGYPGVPNRMETGREVIEIEQKKRDTILKAIAGWELEPLEISHREQRGS